MKQSKVCPKCQGADIVRIPGAKGAFGSGNNIPVGATVFSAIAVTRYLCATCGYSEEWIDSAGDIAALKARFGA